MLTHVTMKSTNKKVGPIPVTTTSAKSCPDACPLKSKGCYAKSGPLYIHWKKVTEGERGLEWSDFLETVKGFPEQQLWRHNQAGDLQGHGNSIDPVKLMQLAKANEGRRGFTYTHYPMDDIINLSSVYNANLMGFTVNLSANSLEHADELMRHRLPVVTLLPEDQLTNKTTPEGHTVVVCPAVTGQTDNCKSCQLCQNSTRKTIVGFPAHGSGKNKVNEITGKEYSDD